MAKKLYSIVEIEELLAAALVIEDKEAQEKELKRIAALSTVKDEIEKAAIAAKVAAAFESAGVELVVEKDEEEEEELVKVKILSSIGSPVGSFSPGDEVLIPAELADSWAKYNLCKKL